MDLSTTGIYGIVALILIGILKDEVKSFLVGILRAIRIYKDRTYDLDGNPETDDVCLANNPATGDWGLVLIHRYNLWTLKSKERGVDFSHINIENGTKIRRHKSFEGWDAMEKGEVTETLNSKEMLFLQDKKLIKIGE
jgi:hypothetical protein